MLTGIRHLNYVNDSYSTTAKVPLSLLDLTKKHSAVVLYAILDRYADPATRQIAATRDQLSAELGNTSRTPVDQAVAELTGLGFLRAERLWVKASKHPLPPAAHEYSLESGKGLVVAGSLYTLLI